MNKQQSKQEWYFNFTSGGFNSVFASTKEEAIKIALDKYSKSKTLNVDINTFRIPTKSEEFSLMSNFY